MNSKELIGDVTAHLADLQPEVELLDGIAALASPPTVLPADASTTIRVRVSPRNLREACARARRTYHVLGSVDGANGSAKIAALLPMGLALDLGRETFVLTIEPRSGPDIRPALTLLQGGTNW